MPRKKAQYYVRPDILHEAIKVVKGKRIAFRGRSDAEVERKMLEYQVKLAQGRTFWKAAADWETDHFEAVAPNPPRAYRPALVWVKATPHIWLPPYFILYTGLRKREALAIQGRDISRKNMVIHIIKSVYHQYGKAWIKVPKSDSGNRDIPLLLLLLPHLPKGLGADAYLFPLDEGKSPLTEAQYNTKWKKYVSSTGITCSAQ